MSDNKQDVCRLCLSNKGLMLPIFRKRRHANETAFRTKLMTCVPIEIFADDELPSKVCYICAHQVEKFFQFQEMCQNSDVVLRSQSKKTIPQNKNTENDQKVKINSTQLQNDFEDQKQELIFSYQPNKFCEEEKPSFDPLTCFICSSIFLTNDDLIEHLTAFHSNITSYFCTVCKISFPHMSLFKSHLSLQHSLNCNHCDFVFKHHSNLQDHIKTHINDKIMCKVCEKVFNDEFEMKKHELVHLEKTCNYCSEEFETKQDYYSHVKECVKNYQCKFCNEIFECKKDLIEHVNNCHDSCVLQKCNNCQKTFIPNISEPHQCESYVEQMFQCQHCETQFLDEASLVSHMSTEHSGDVLSCRFCTKKFSLKSSLKRHEKSHSGVKPYQCKYCPRKFKDSSACVVHTRTHTGEHPFQCQECHKDFKQLANLKMHTYRHHKKNKVTTEEKSKDLNQGQHQNFEHLYAGDIMENYSNSNMRGYQNLGETISTTFNQSMNILMSEHT